ncbi:hypothetical protein ACA910_008174 [Epithemia clementina (nom. ined.)]
MNDSEVLQTPSRKTSLLRTSTPAMVSGSLSGSGNKRKKSSFVLATPVEQVIAWEPTSLSSILAKPNNNVRCKRSRILFDDDDDNDEQRQYFSAPAVASMPLLPEDLDNNNDNEDDDDDSDDSDNSHGSGHERDRESLAIYSIPSSSRRRGAAVFQSSTLFNTMPWAASSVLGSRGALRLRPSRNPIPSCLVLEERDLRCSQAD